MTYMNDIKAIFFDFDGVLTPLSSGCYTTCLNLEKRKSELRLGTLPIEDFWMELCAAVGQNLDIELLYQAYRDTPPDPVMWQLAAKLRDNYKVGIITNNPKKRLEILEQKFDIAKKFDSIICSSRLGVKKPDAEIYAAAVASLNVAPSQCAYMDNSEKDVQGARDFGLHSFHFDDAKRDYKSLEAWLGGLGVKV